jgi:hypothetical protein
LAKVRVKASTSECAVPGVDLDHSSIKAPVNDLKAV